MLGSAADTVFDRESSARAAVLSSPTRSAEQHSPPPQQPAMRQLKHHEQKLLKKVNFFSYKKENNVREIKILRRYHIQDREDYVKYNKIVGHVTELVRRIKALDTKDPFRMNLTDQLLDKLYTGGIVPTKKGLAVCDKLSASSLCRRRLPVVMVRLHMSETLREAVTFIEQGHIRVGPDVVTDPAFLVTRPLEDFITWTDSSKIKRKVTRSCSHCRRHRVSHRTRARRSQGLNIYWHQSEWD